MWKGFLGELLGKHLLFLTISQQRLASSRFQPRTLRLTWFKFRKIASDVIIATIILI